MTAQRLKAAKEPASSWAGLAQLAEDYFNERPSCCGWAKREAWLVRLYVVGVGAEGWMT